MWNTVKGLANLKAYLVIFGLLLAGFVAQAYLANVPIGLFESLRFVLITLLFLISFVRKKMSLWIFSAMVLGIEVGMDFPSFALEMERLAKIFLRLIKTLVAPLIFATLVVGIAGHSNLKQVGRMGLKSIIYFEIVTTLALFIGLMAINITQAGKGVQVEVNEKVKEKSTELLAQRSEHKDHIVEKFSTSNRCFLRDFCHWSRYGEK
jgi:proton glutamate symport protein